LKGRKEKQVQLDSLSRGADELIEEYLTPPAPQKNMAIFSVKIVTNQPSKYCIQSLQ